LRGHLRHSLVAIPSQELQLRFHRHGSTQRRFDRQNWSTRRRNHRHRTTRRSRLVGTEKHYQTTLGKQEFGQVSIKKLKNSTGRQMSTGKKNINFTQF
jgi:hypothetical protein